MPQKSHGTRRHLRHRLVQWEQRPDDAVVHEHQLVESAEFDLDMRKRRNPRRKIHARVLANEHQVSQVSRRVDESLHMIGAVAHEHGCHALRTQIV